MFGTPTPTSGLGCWSKAKEGQGLGTHQWGALWPAGAQCLLLHAGAQGLGLRVEAGGRGMQGQQQGGGVGGVGLGMGLSGEPGGRH